MIHRWQSSTYISLSIILLAVASSLFSGVAAAAPASAADNAIRVSPALSNVQLSPGETSTTIVTTITNQTSSPLVVDLTARDFGASLTNQAGAISFYGNRYNPNTNPHGLQTVVSFATPKITLEPKSSQQVAVTLNNVNKLAAGGHYGAVLFSPESLAASTSKANVSIHAAIASLIFLKTASGGTQTLQLLPFSVSSIRFNLPSTNYVAFNDTGNSQTAPEGQLTLYGPSGAIISTTVLNPGSGLILPGTSRLFTITLPFPNMRFARPGIYRMELQYRDGLQKNFTVVNRSFFYINLSIFVPVVLLLISIIYFLRWRGSELLDLMKRLIRIVLHSIKKSKAKTVVESHEKPKHPRHPKKVQ